VPDEAGFYPNLDDAQSRHEHFPRDPVQSTYVHDITMIQLKVRPIV
jgi:hypothetical protein